MDTFKIYKGQTEVVSGTSPLTITGMEPDTSVPAGEYQVTRVVNGKESERVDIPAFKTLSIAVTGLEFSPKTSTADAGTAGSRQITATVLPENATNKKVTYKITPETEGLAVSETGNITLKIKFRGQLSGCPFLMEEKTCKSKLKGKNITVFLESSLFVNWISSMG